MLKNLFLMLDLSIISHIGGGLTLFLLTEVYRTIEYGILLHMTEEVTAYTATEITPCNDFALFLRKSLLKCNFSGQANHFY